MMKVAQELEAMETKKSVGWKAENTDTRLRPPHYGERERNERRR